MNGQPREELRDFGRAHLCRVRLAVEDDVPPFLPSSARQVAAETVSQLAAPLGVTLAEFFAPFSSQPRPASWWRLASRRELLAFRRCEGRMNGGGTPVELHTTNGDIRLGPRQTAEATTDTSAPGSAPTLAGRTDR